MVHLVFANTHTRPKKPKELFFQRYQAVDKFEKKIIEHQKRLNIFDISQMKTNQSEGKILRGKSEKKKGLLLRYVPAELDINMAILSKIERKAKEQILKLAEILDLDKDGLLVKYLSEKTLNS